jgi:hypothetical protein
MKDVKCEACGQLTRSLRCSDGSVSLCINKSCPLCRKPRPILTDLVFTVSWDGEVLGGTGPGGVDEVD